MSKDIKTVSPKEMVLQNLGNMRSHFAQALPPDVSVDQFTRVVLTAVQQNMDLLAVQDKQSLYNACVKAAQDGLLPDGREGALVIFKNKDGDSWKTGVQWMPMVAGLIKRAAKSNIVLDAQVVYSADKFEYALGDAPTIIHVPASFAENRGDVIGVYAIATLPDGSKKREVMSKADVEIVRSKSRAQNSLGWGTFWGEMARKTVIRRLFKSLPLDPQSVKPMTSAITRIDEDYEELTIPPQAVTEPPAATATAAPTASKARDKILAQDEQQATEKPAPKATAAAPQEDLI